MGERNPTSPLDPANLSQRSDQLEETAVLKKHQRIERMKCYGCIAALFLILAIVIVVLIFFVFPTKDPVITMNHLTITQLQLVNGTIPKPGTNISFIADVSVKNPNYATFKYKNTTTSLYYRGQKAGEARTGPGRAKARRTVHMNVTVDIQPDKLMSNPNLTADLGSGLLAVTTYSRVPGKVKIIVVKKHIIVKMNCSISFNVSAQTIQTQKCKRHVDFF